jgi:hypothetical protein
MSRCLVGGLSARLGSGAIAGIVKTLRGSFRVTRLESGLIGEAAVTDNQTVSDCRLRRNLCRHLQPSGFHPETKASAARTFRRR